MKYIFLLLIIANILIAKDTQNSIDKEKVYKIGILKDWAPYYVTRNNKPAGYAIELFEKIAKNLNIKYQYICTNSWEELFSLIQKKEIDIIPNLGIALNRIEYLNFTQTTDLFEVGFYKNTKLTNIKEIKNKKIGVVENNVCTKLINNNLYKNKIVFTSFYDSLNALNENNIDILCYPKPLIEYSIKHFNLENIQSFGEPLKIVNRAIGINKNEIVLLKSFDKEISKLKANGEYQEIHNRWFKEQKDIQIDYEELLIIILVLIVIFFNIIYYLKRKDEIVTKKQLTNKLKEINSLHKRLYLAADKALAGYWEWHLDTNYLHLSKGWKKYLGYQDDELKNSFQTFQKVMHPDDFETTMNIVNTYIETKQGTYRTKFRLKHKDGTYKWTSAIGTISEENENIFFGFHIDIDDLTTTKETLVAQSKSAMMGEMISAIAHQLKQPLSIISITASSQIASIELEEEITNEIIIKDANESLKQVLHLSDTIDTFRDFLKPDHKKIDSKIDTIVESSLSIVNKSLRNNDIQVIKNFSQTDTIKVYNSELMQIFINLLNNSKDAFKLNNIKNRVITLDIFQKENNIIVKIEDTAGGIAPDAINSIFKAYFTTKENEGGTGIGLYIVKTIIEEHYNGSIEVKNKDAGVVFTLTFPL